LKLLTGAVSAFDQVTAATPRMSSTQPTDTNHGNVSAVALTSPVRHAERPTRFSVQRYQTAEPLPRQVHTRTANPLVHVLFVPRRPTTVIRRVWPIVVRPAIQRVLGRWTQSHIQDERSNAIAPPLAHRDASASIEVKARVTRFMATIQRRAPRTVFWVPPRHVFSDNVITEPCQGGAAR
jgi:hypothetical protein